MPIIWKALASALIFAGGFFAGAICNAAGTAADDDLREHRRKYAESQQDD